MKVLVPLLTGFEKDPIFVSAVTDKVDEVILLQIVDKEFHARAGSAIGEVRQLRLVLDELRKSIGAKKKKCVELTEWGSTIQKIISLVLLQKIDKVYLVKQNNQFFEDILKALSKNKIKYGVIDVPIKVEDNKK
ncbi:MAG: hypothetical protein NTY48_03490 [Candidatus Diapherotrites archaeon]|nr:hypothetical protein [Candidatus Diapherotrites archaeon]